MYKYNCRSNKLNIGNKINKIGSFTKSTGWLQEFQELRLSWSIFSEKQQKQQQNIKTTKITAKRKATAKKKNDKNNSI